MARYRGKHRKPSSTRHTIARFGVVGATIATPIAIAAPAHAGGKDWDALAQCESSGNWAANTGNGFSGGLQFTPSTWSAYGGTKYANNAANATREQQIEVAERVLAAQGAGAWPVCSVKTGFVGGGGGSEPGGGSSPSGSSSPGAPSGDNSSPDNSSPDTSSPDTSSGDNSPSEQTPDQTTDQDTGAQPRQAGDYTVQSGDTLSGIGKHLGVDWHVIFTRNSTTVHDPNLIFPGEQLALR